MPLGFLVSLAGAWATEAQPGNDDPANPIPPPAFQSLPEHEPIRALLFTGGCCHDYPALVPFITSNINRQITVQFDVAWTLNPLTNKAFAAKHDVVVYDVCFRDADPGMLENALDTLRQGKPVVILHCGVHAFRDSPKVHDWEYAIGMRSKVHDRFQGFGTEKLDPTSVILKDFPDHWHTTGDELYQTIELISDSHPLLKAKSPSDGREHTVCWTHPYGKGRVFATTLGHDMHTVADPDYLRLVTNGLLWACGRGE